MANQQIEAGTSGLRCEETSASLPWSDCKAAFDINDAGAAWKMPADSLPAGWSMCEADVCSTHAVAVFRVRGLPTAVDGQLVVAALRKAGAL